MWKVRCETLRKREVPSKRSNENGSGTGPMETKSGFYRHRPLTSKPTSRDCWRGRLMVGIFFLTQLRKFWKVVERFQHLKRLDISPKGSKYLFR